jgi:hypothetical protein
LSYYSPANPLIILDHYYPGQVRSQARTRIWNLFLSVWDSEDEVTDPEYSNEIKGRYVSQKYVPISCVNQTFCITTSVICHPCFGNCYQVNVAYGKTIFTANIEKYYI